MVYLEESSEVGAQPGVAPASASFEDALAALGVERAGKAAKPIAVIPLALAAELFRGRHDVNWGQWRSGYEYEWVEDAPRSEDIPELGRLPEASMEEIQAELDLGRARTERELTELRRKFMWRNHPDRRPDLPRELANARVAIANMLVDRALVELSAHPPPPGLDRP